MADINELQKIAEEAVGLVESTTDPDKKAEFAAIAEDAVSALEQAKQMQQNPVPSTGRDPDVPYADEAMNAQVEADRIQAEKDAVMEGPLRPPAPELFEGNNLTMEEVRERRARYEQDPSFVDNWLGMDEVTVDGKRYLVPDPYQDIFSGKPKVSNLDKVYGGAVNAGANLIELGAAGVDYAANSVVGEGASNLTEKVQSNIPKMAAGEDLGDQLIIGATEVAIGLVTGSNAVNALSKARTAAQTAKGLKPAVEKTVNNLAKFVGAEAGMSATVGSDAGTLFVGPSAVVPALKGWELPGEPSKAKDVLQAKANILSDALILAGPLTAVGKGMAYTAGFMKGAFVDPILGVFSQNKREQALVNNILERLASVGGATSKEESDAIKREIVEIIRENKELVVDMGEREVTVGFDTMTALQQGLDVTKGRQAEVAMEANNLRSGVLTQGGTKTQVASEAPAKGVVESTNVLQGSGEAVTPAAKGIVDEAMAPVRMAEDRARNAAQALTEAENSIPVMIKDDPEMGARLVNLEKETGLDIYSGPSDSVDKIVAGVRKAYETMKAEKDDLFAAIQGGDLNYEAVSGMFGEMSKDQLDAFTQALPPRSPVLKLRDELTPRTITVVDEAGKPVMKPKLDAKGAPLLDAEGKAVMEQEVREETAEEMATRVNTFLAENGIDFGMMYREVRPALAEAASNLYGSASSAGNYAGAQTRRSIQYIDENLLDWVSENSDPETAMAATAAKDYYEETFAPYWKQGKLGEIATLYDGTVGRTNARMADKGLEMKPVDFKAGTSARVQDNLTNSQRAYAGHLVDLLSRGESPVPPSEVTDFILGNATIAMANSVRRDGLSKLDLGAMMQSLGEYASVLRDNFPEEYARLNAFIGKVQAAQKDVATKERLAKEALDNAAEMEKLVTGTTLKGFFQEVTGEVTENGYVAFEKMLSKADNMGQVGEIVDIARQSGNPTLIKGLQQAYASTLRRKLFGGTYESGGSQAIKLGNTEKLMSEETSSLLAYGDVIFKDNPVIMEGLRSVVSVAQGAAIGKRGRAFAGASNTAFSQEASKTMDRLVLAFIGPLTRIGARIRSATGTVIATLSPDDAAKLTMDLIMSNPEEFTRIADRALKEPTVSKETQDMVFATLVRAGIYGPTDEEGVMEAMRSAASIETQMRGAFQEDTDTMDEEMRSLFFAE